MLGMARADTAQLPEAPDVLQRHRQRAVGGGSLHLGQVQERVQEHRGVPGRQDEPVAVQPRRIVNVVTQRVVPQRVADRRQRHRGARMPGLRGLDRVDGEGADRVDGQPVVAATGQVLACRLLAGSGGRSRQQAGEPLDDPHERRVIETAVALRAAAPVS